MLGRFMLDRILQIFHESRAVGWTCFTARKLCWAYFITKVLFHPVACSNITASLDVSNHDRQGAYNLL